MTGLSTRRLPFPFEGTASTRSASSSVMTTGTTGTLGRGRSGRVTTHPREARQGTTEMDLVVDRCWAGPVLCSPPGAYEAAVEIAGRPGDYAGAADMHAAGEDGWPRNERSAGRSVVGPAR